FASDHERRLACDIAATKTPAKTQRKASVATAERAGAVKNAARFSLYACEKEAGRNVNLVAEAHPDLRREIVHLLIHARWEYRDAAPDAEVVRHAVSKSRKEQLIVGKVALALPQHLTRWRKEH